MARSRRHTCDRWWRRSPPAAWAPPRGHRNAAGVRGVRSCQLRLRQRADRQRPGPVYVGCDQRHLCRTRAGRQTRLGGRDARARSSPAARSTSRPSDRSRPCLSPRGQGELVDSAGDELFTRLVEDRRVAWRLTATGAVLRAGRTARRCSSTICSRLGNRPALVSHLAVEPVAATGRLGAARGPSAGRAQDVAPDTRCRLRLRGPRRTHAHR